MFRWWLRGAAAIALLAGVAAIWLHFLTYGPLEFGAERLEFTLKPGSSARSAGRQLAQAGVPVKDWQIEMLARLRGNATALKAGTYSLPNGITPHAILERLVRGEVIPVEVRLLEGWTFRQFRKALASNPDLRSDTATLSESAILGLIGATETTAEGLFFPTPTRSPRGRATSRFSSLPTPR